MRWIGILVMGLVFGLSGCGTVGSSHPASAPSPQGTPPSASAGVSGSPSAFGNPSNASRTPGVSVTIPGGPASTSVTIRLNTTGVDHAESQALTSEIDQLNQLLQTLQHP